jgi:hypothetical protein
MKVWLKSCPRCAGDLLVKADIEGSYVECVQCGSELSPVEEAFLARLGYVPRNLAPMEAPPVLAEGRRHSA